MGPLVSIEHSLMDTRERAQLHCQPCFERDQKVSTFCAQFLLNKGSYQRMLIFLLPNIVILSASLDVVI